TTPDIYTLCLHDALPILAHTTHEKMRDIINLKVKKREPFRPFAPVILAEQTASYFESDPDLSLSCDYMLSVYPFHKKVQKKVPRSEEHTSELQSRENLVC